MIMGIDHGYYAIKTRHFSFPAGVTAYTHEPYTLKNTLQIGGKYYVCGTGRQPILRDKTVNDISADESEAKLKSMESAPTKHGRSLR